MKKRTMAGALLLTMAIGMTACSGGQSQPVQGTTVLSFDQDAEYSAEWNTGTGQTTGITGTGQTVGTAGAGQTTGTTGSTTITAEDAKVIVAGKIPGIDTASIYLSQDYDDGRWVYEGDAYYNQTEYEFEIDAATGQVISWEQESIYD